MIYKKYPFLKSNNGEKIFINADTIQNIGKQLKIGIVTYTELGAMIGKPWDIFGYPTGKKKINIKIQNEHATILPASIAINNIEYHEILTIPSTTDIVKHAYTYPEQTTRISLKLTQQEYKAEQEKRKAKAERDKTPKFYIQLTAGQFTMHKLYKPSSITNDPNDDTNLEYSYIFDDNQMLYQKFKQEYNLYPIQDEAILNVAKKAEHFIGRKQVEYFEHNHLANMTEYDHNKNYLAYEKLPEYLGFPTNKLIPMKLEHAKNPAFVAIKDIENYPESFHHFYKYKGGPITLAFPTYKYLVSQNAIVTVDYVLEGEFQHVSVADFATKNNIPEDKIKLFRNSLIGRTISGGIKGAKMGKFTYGNEQEKQQLIHECQVNKLDWDENEDTNQIFAKVDTKARGIFNFHSYILAYAAIHMMKKWKSLEDQNIFVEAYNVDALLVSGKHHENSLEIGGWKTMTPPKPYYANFSYEHEWGAPQRENAIVKVPNRLVPTENTLIIGPAGISKSYPWVIEELHGQIMQTPPHYLKDQHLRSCTTLNVCTVHKYFQFSVSDESHKMLRRNKKIPHEHNYIIIDEAFMFNSKEWKTIMRRKGHSTIIALGDPYQITNEIESDCIDLRWFKREGFNVQELERIEGAHARHMDFEYGQRLDILRKMRYEHQVDFVKEKFTTIPEFSMDMANVETDKIIVGNHAAANRYNDHARRVMELKGGLFPFKKLGKKPIIEMKLIFTNNVWWDRTKMSQKPPKDAKYEPAFAVTADSIQGQTMEDNYKIFVDVESLRRHGALYTAMTRTRLEKNTIPILAGLDGPKTEDEF